jgi:hypothetical protein
MATRSTTTTTTPAATDKPKRTRKPKTETAAPAVPVEVPTGRVVANPARPARLGFSLALRQAAEQAGGWTVKEVSDPSPEIVHIYANPAKGVAPAGGAVLTHKDGPVIRVSFFETRDGTSDRLDAAYLWLPGATSGRRVQTVYQVMATIMDAGKAVASPEASRKRPTTEASAAPTAVEVPASTVAAEEA